MRHLLSRCGSYPIRPNYYTVHLGFLNLLGKLVLKYVPAYYRYALKKRSANDLFDVYVIFFWFSL